MCMNTRIHDILDRAVSKWVGNTAHILEYLFNSASRHYCEVWSSQFPFFHNVSDTFPPSEACLYGHINWCLAQSHQQTSLGFSQSSSSMRGARAKWKAGFMFTVQKGPVLVSNGLPLALKTYFTTRTERHQSGRKSAWAHLLVPLTLGRRGTMGAVFLMCYSLQLHQHYVHLLCRLVHFQKFWIKGEALPSVGLYLIWLQVPHLQLRWHTLFFHNFKLFNTKAAMAHHPIIQKDVDELLARDAIDPWMGGVSLYSYIYGS